MIGQCDVCVLVHGDFAEDKAVKHCGICDAWLCERCRNSGLTVDGIIAIKNRVKAALISHGLMEGVA